MAVAHGVSIVFFGAQETAYGEDPTAWVGGDALSLIDLKIEPSVAFTRSQERRGSASVQGEIQGMESGKWSARCYLRTAAAGTAPPMDRLLRLVNGQAPTLVTSTSATYALSDNALSIRLARYIATNLYEHISGAIVEQLDVEVTGGSEPVLTFSGSYSRYSWVVGGAAATGSVATGASTFTLATTSRGKVGAGVRVNIGADTNSGAGYLITAVDQSTGVCTFSPVLAGGGSTNPAITPVVATPSYGSGTIRGGIENTATIDSTAYGVTSAKISIKTGFHLLTKEITSRRATGVARGLREVTVDIKAYYRDEGLARFRGRAFDGLTSAVTLRVGQTTAGAGADFAMPAVRLDVQPIEVPEAEEAMIKFSGVARMSSASNDELSIAFN